MESVYVLIETDPVSVEKVVSDIRAIDGVQRVDAVTGVCDILALVEGDDISEVLNTVMRKLRKVEGIRSTETLVVMKM